MKMLRYVVRSVDWYNGVGYTMFVFAPTPRDAIEYVSLLLDIPTCFFTAREV